MHLDTADLGASKILLIIDVVDMIFFNYREYSAQMTYDSCLSAVMDVASSDEMASDILFGPSFTLSLKDAVTLCLSTILLFLMEPVVVISGLTVFSERDT
jgi:hypothetical protein